MNAQLTKLGQTSLKLSKLERAWYKEYLAMGCVNATQSLRIVYQRRKKPINEITIGTLASALRKSVYKKLGISHDDIMEAMGITEDYLMQVGLEGLKATRPIFVNGQPQAVADYQTRHKYWQDFNKIKNILKDKIELEGDIKSGIQVNIQVNNGFTTATEQVETTPDRSDAEQPTEVQGSSVAQEKQEDNNSNPRDTQTSTS